MVAAMPGVTIVDVPADGVITYGGAIHCVVKTIPTQAWPDPCNDLYDFNDADCTPEDTGEPKTDTPTADDDGDEMKLSCACSSAGSAGGWALMGALLLTWGRRRW